MRTAKLYLEINLVQSGASTRTEIDEKAFT